MAELNMKNIKADFKSKGIYYTPPELAEKLKKCIPEDVTEIYDPTCGQGNLLSVFPDNVKKYGQDINESEIEKAKEILTNFTGEYGDTLADPKFNRTFDYIVANPPFSVEWTPCIIDEDAPIHPTKSRADYAFILHILKHLNKKAAVLEFPGVLYRQAREKQIREWIIENGWIETIEMIPADTFVDTKITTALIVFNKEKKDKKIKFIDENGEHTANYKEIKENNFNLSTSTYIQKPDNREKIDIKKLNVELELESFKKRATAINLQKLTELIKYEIEEEKEKDLSEIERQALNYIEYCKESILEAEYNILRILETLVFFKESVKNINANINKLKPYKNLKANTDKIKVQAKRILKAVEGFTNNYILKTIEGYKKIEPIEKVSEDFEFIKFFTLLEPPKDFEDINVNDNNNETLFEIYEKLDKKIN